MKKAALVSAAAAVFLSACWHPAYDVDLRDSRRFAGRLGSPVATFDVTLEDSDGASAGYYIPPRDGVSYSSGFWVRRETGYLQVRCMRTDASGNAWFPSWGYSTEDRFSGSSVCLPLATDPASLVVLANMNNCIVRILGDTVTGSFTESGSLIEASSIGGGSSPVSASSDRFFLAVLGSGVLDVYYFSLSGAETFPAPLVLFASFSSTSAFPLAATVSDPCFVALSPDNTDLFVSGTMSDGSIGTYVWRGFPFTADPVALPTIDRKITGILSDGRLVSRYDGGFAVYDTVAGTSFEVASAGVHFVGERYDSGSSRWVSLFTLATSIETDSSESLDSRIEVFEFPTDELDTLAD